MPSAFEGHGRGNCFGRVRGTVSTPLDPLGGGCTGPKLLLEQNTSGLFEPCTLLQDMAAAAVRNLRKIVESELRRYRRNHVVDSINKRFR